MNRVSRVEHCSPSPPGPVFCGQCCFRLPILLLVLELRNVVTLPAVDDVVSFAGVSDAEGGSVDVIVGWEVANATTQGHRANRPLSHAC